MYLGCGEEGKEEKFSRFFIQAPAWELLGTAQAAGGVSEEEVRPGCAEGGICVCERMRSEAPEHVGPNAITSCFFDVVCLVGSSVLFVFSPDLYQELI